MGDWPLSWLSINRAISLI